MPLSPASLCWRMSRRICFPQCQNKASKYGITAVTENVTVPLLYMSARVNIMATLAAPSLLFETMPIHRKWAQTMEMKRIDFSGDGDLQVGLNCLKNSWMWPSFKALKNVYFPCDQSVADSGCQRAGAKKIKKGTTCTGWGTCTAKMVMHLRWNSFNFWLIFNLFYCTTTT